MNDVQVLAVDDQLVGVGEPAQDLGDDEGADRERQPPRGRETTEIDAADALHDQIEDAVVVAVEVEYGDDVRVVQERGETGLVDEHLAKARIGRERGEDALDRHLARKPLGADDLRLDDFRHSTATNALSQAIFVGDAGHGGYDRGVVVHGDTAQVLDRNALRADVDILRHELSEIVGPGDARIAILAGISAEFVIAREALADGGFTAVPINHKLTPREVAYILRHSAARALLVAPPLRPLAEAALAGWTRAPTMVGIGPALAGSGAPSERVGATLIYTSGTTGEPKGCLRTEAQERARADELIASYDICADDTQLIASPLAHSGPGIFLRAGRRAGARTVLLPRFDAEAVLAAIEAHRVTFFFMVPTQLERLLAVPAAMRERCDVDSVRAVIVAGAPLRADLRERVETWLGPRLWEFYGSSETGTVSVLGPEDARIHPSSVGRLAPGVGVRIVDPDGAEVPRGTVGEIFVRSPTLMAGYTIPENLRYRPREDFISVGDLGRQSADGFLFLEGRKDDTIITGGVNVYPAEVERALIEHPAVAQCIVFGRDDREWGQRVEALITAHPEGPAPTHAELKTFLATRLAGFKIPKVFSVTRTEDMPVGASGKPLRRLAGRVPSTAIS